MLQSQKPGDVLYQIPQFLLFPPFPLVLASIYKTAQEARKVEYEDSPMSIYKSDKM